MVSFRRRRNACRLSLRPSASSARARSAADHVRSAVISISAIWSRVQIRGVALWTPKLASHRPSLISGAPDEGRRLAREQLLTLSVGESRISRDVVDDHRLAATARVDGGLAEARDGPRPANGATPSQ